MTRVRPRPVMQRLKASKQLRVSSCNDWPFQTPRRSALLLWILLQSMSLPKLTMAGDHVFASTIATMTTSRNDKEYSLPATTGRKDDLDWSKMLLLDPKFVVVVEPNNRDGRQIERRWRRTQAESEETTAAATTSAVSPSLSNSTKPPPSHHHYDAFDEFKSHLSRNPRVADLQEGFFFALVAFIVIGCVYRCCCCCCGRDSNNSCCGICLVDRIERQRRRARIVQDGRGVFAPVIGDDEEFAEYGEENGRIPRRTGGGRMTLANEYGDPEDWDPDDDNILEASAHEYFHDDDDDHVDDDDARRNHTNGGVELTSLRGKS